MVYYEYFNVITERFPNVLSCEIFILISTVYLVSTALLFTFFKI